MKNMSWPDVLLNYDIVVDDKRNVMLYEYDAAQIRRIPEGKHSLSAVTLALLDKFDDINLAD